MRRCAYTGWGRARLSTTKWTDGWQRRRVRLDQRAGRVGSPLCSSSPKPKFPKRRVRVFLRVDPLGDTSAGRWLARGGFLAEKQNKHSALSLSVAWYKGRSSFDKRSHIKMSIRYKKAVSRRCESKQHGIVIDGRPRFSFTPPQPVSPPHYSSYCGSWQRVVCCAGSIRRCR